jgi:flagellar hook-length control protein FliK
MDAINATTTSNVQATSGSSSTSSNNGTGTVKSGEDANSFQKVLQNAQQSETQDGQGKAEEGTLSLLAALAGGWNPLLVLQMPQDVQAEGVAPQPMRQISPEWFNNLPSTNGELASLLKQFGASDDLLRVLLSHPQGSPQETLAQHLDLLDDFQSVLKQMTVETALSKPTAVFGKLQASLSAHALHVTREVSSAQGHSAEEAHTVVTGLLTGAPLQIGQLQQPLKQQSQTVTIHADQFRTQFPETIIKSATLLQSPGRHEFRILLNPQGLGEIEVRVQAIGQHISLQFHADTTAAKSLLDSELANLRSQLQSQGIQFDRIEVTSGRNNVDINSGLPQERQNGQNSQGQEGNHSSRRRVETEIFSLDGVEEAIDGSLEQPVPNGLDVTA